MQMEGAYLGWSSQLWCSSRTISFFFFLFSFLIVLRLGSGSPDDTVQGLGSSRPSNGPVLALLVRLRVKCLVKKKKKKKSICDESVLRALISGLFPICAFKTSVR